MKHTIIKISALLFLLLASSCDYSKNTLNTIPSGYFENETSKIHYKTYGEGDNTLIFIHGWGCDMNTWKYQFNDFKEDYHLVLIDLPGFGLSENKEKDYGIDIFAEAVLSLINQLDIKNPVLIAHSMGFPVAVEVLKQLKSEDAILCNIDGVYFNFPKDSTENVQYKKGLEGFADMFNKNNYEQNINQFCNDFISESTPTDVKEYILSTMLKTPQDIGYQSMKSLINEKYWDKTLIKNQSLSIYAKTENLHPDNEDMLKTQFPNLSYIEMDSVNHFLMMEKPKQVNLILKRFIEQHTKS
jgi:pimeloyl-ACP methyl ester carboxylesterase